MNPYVLQTAYALVAIAGALAAWIVVRRPWNATDEELEIVGNPSVDELMVDEESLGEEPLD